MERIIDVSGQDHGDVANGEVQVQEGEVRDRGRNDSTVQDDSNLTPDQLFEIAQAFDQQQEEIDRRADLQEGEARGGGRSEYGEVSKMIESHRLAMDVVAEEFEHSQNLRIEDFKLEFGRLLEVFSEIKLIRHFDALMCDNVGNPDRFERFRSVFQEFVDGAIKTYFKSYNTAVSRGYERAVADVNKNHEKISALITSPEVLRGLDKSTHKLLGMITTDDWSACSLEQTIDRMQSGKPSPFDIGQPVLRLLQETRSKYAGDFITSCHKLAAEVQETFGLQFQGEHSYVDPSESDESDGSENDAAEQTTNNRPGYYVYDYDGQVTPTEDPETVSSDATTGSA